MSSTFEKQLQEINQLIVYGKFKEAEEIITKAIKKKDISKEEELRFLVYKSELELYFGNYDESIQLADHVLKNSKEIDNPLLIVDALTWKAACSFLNGKIKVSNKCFEDGLKQVSKIKNLPAKAIAKRKAQLLLWQAYAINYLGNFEKGLELANEVLSFAEISGYKNLVSYSLFVKGECYFMLNMREKSAECFEMAFAIATELKNKYLTALYYLLIPRTTSDNWVRETEKATKSYKKGFSLAEEIGAKMLFIYKNDFALIYRAAFQLDKALRYFHEAIDAAPFMNWLSNVNIGVTLFLKYELEQAQEYLLKAMEFCEEINDRYQLQLSLYNLIEISIELNDSVQAKKYLNRLKELSKETGFARIEQVYRNASIYILKASGKVNDLAKAAKLLNDLLADENLSPYNRLQTLYSILEIRLKELQFSPNKDTLKEVQKRLYHLEVEAEDQQWPMFLIDVYRLQSQLALVELDIKKSLDLLEKAQVIADEIDVERLKKAIKDDRERINQQLTMLQKFQEQQTPISETIKLVSLESSAQNIKQETVIEERDQETGEIIEYRKLFALKL
ncbi:MAG: hypothetical protein FK733_10145 [Asgard group archaeon]|nr:hypothetical protein [Asgard group archaeon]